jgi:hypothetical protein
VRFDPSVLSSRLRADASQGMILPYTFYMFFPPLYALSCLTTIKSLLRGSRNSFCLIVLHT